MDRDKVRLRPNKTNTVTRHRTNKKHWSRHHDEKQQQSKNLVEVEEEVQPGKTEEAGGLLGGLRSGSGSGLAGRMKRGDRVFVLRRSMARGVLI